MIEGFDLITQLFHLGERTKLDMSRPVPQINDASQLADIKILHEFERIVKEIIRSDDGEVALLGRRVLEDIVLPQYPKIRNANPQAYDRYQKLISILKFLNLVIYGLKDIDKIVKETLVSALLVGIPVKQKFQRVLDDFDDLLMEGEIAESLANAMMICEEKLGHEVLFLKDEKKSVSQTAGNWLKDYIQFSLVGAERATGSLERTEYFRNNLNVKNLSEAEKNVLLQILRLYDWLRYGTEIEEEAKVQKDVERLSYPTSKKLEVPEEVLSVVQSQPPPTIPIPANQKPQRPIEEIQAPRPQAQSPVKVLPKPVAPPPVQAVSKPYVLPVVPPKDKAFIDDLIKRNKDKDAFQPGLKFGEQGDKSLIPNPSPVSLGASRGGSLTVDKKQAEIDKKLEDLGKRMKN